MKIVITKKGCGTWEECANLIINTKKGEIFSSYNKSNSILIDNWHQSAKTTEIGRYFASRSIVKRLNNAISLGLAEVEPKLEKRSDDVECWVIKVNTEAFTFPYLHIPLDRMYIYYGKCKEIPSIEILKSECFRPSEWYVGMAFGNKYSGGTEYEYKGNAPEFKLEQGYEMNHHSSGAIDGWGTGFKGGSYIVNGILSKYN